MKKESTFWGCLKLLEKCIEQKLVISDPNDNDRILVCRVNEDGEYWTSQNIFSAAQELLHDDADKEYLLSEVRKKDPNFELPVMPDFFTTPLEDVTDRYQGNGRIYILTGESASGKDTLLKHMLATDPFLESIVSFTTRPMRDGEVDGKDYRFVSKEQFEKGIENDDFIEYRSYETLVNGKSDVWYYGSGKCNLSAHKDYIVILDLEGAKTFVDYYGKENCFVINLRAGDDVRKKRAMRRGSFDETEWNRRLEDDKVKFGKANGITNIVIETDKLCPEEIANQLFASADEYFRKK